MVQKKAWIVVVKLPNDITDYFLRRDSTPENYQTAHKFGDNVIWHDNHNACMHLNHHAEKMHDAKFFLAEIVLVEYHDNQG